VRLSNNYSLGSETLSLHFSKHEKVSGLTEPDQSYSKLNEDRFWRSSNIHNHSVQDQMSEIAHMETLAYFRSRNMEIDLSTNEYTAIYLVTLSTIVAAQSTINKFTPVGYPSPQNKTNSYKRYGVHNSPVVNEIAYYDPIQHCWMSHSSNEKLS
jgi:hypothetical protein